VKLLMTLSLLFAGCASVAEPPLRVLVYNIHAGKDAKGVDNLERVVALIGSTRADLVLLQEVDRGTRRSGNVDQLAILEEKTGLRGVFGKSLDFQGGDYGIAILSRWPIPSHETVPLRIDPPQPRAGGSLEPRVALFATIDRPSGRLTIANTHFDASPEDTWRRQEAADLIAAMASRRPHLVGGDFNSTPDSVVQQTLRGSGLVDTWSICGRGDDLTYPAGTPVKRIDYLFLTGSARCTDARVLETEASDHRPVLIEVTMR
jgi:endonuclease/exonuclease/phosphatase family metal-dependent hydrolase